MNKLNFGCGKRKIEGFVNVDKEDFDFNKFPYPYKDNTFDYILADNVLEHLDDLIRTFNELHRISKNKTVIEIISPFWLHPAVQSIGHKEHTITADWLRPIVDNLEYNDTRFRIIKGKFDLIRYEYISNFKFIPKFLINKFANIIPCLVINIKHCLLVKKDFKIK